MKTTSAGTYLDAFAYLALANDLIHEIDPNAWTFAEDVSGLPGLAAPIPQGGAAFDFRLAMGVTDLWFKLTDIPDEHWDLYRLWYELINRRQDERTVAYLECHDQAMVGGQSFIFKLIGIDIYPQMHVGSKSLAVDRGSHSIKADHACHSRHGYQLYGTSPASEWIIFQGKATTGRTIR